MPNWLKRLFGGAQAGQGINLETADPKWHERFNDYSRRYITYFLIGLLTCIIIFALYDLYLINDQAIDTGTLSVHADDAKADADRLVQILNIVFGPVVTLLGTATGFYFGTKSQDASATARPGPGGPATDPNAAPGPAPAPQPGSGGGGPILVSVAQPGPNP